MWVAYTVQTLAARGFETVFSRQGGGFYYCGDVSGPMNGPMSGPMNGPMYGPMNVPMDQMDETLPGAECEDA